MKLCRRSTLSVLALLASTTAVFAQERIRASGMDDVPGDQTCQLWDVGFEYSHCERMPVPGSDNEMTQVYTLTDGTRRMLGSDPEVSSKRDMLDAAADDGGFGAEPSNDEPVSATAAATQDRGVIGAQIQEATGQRPEGATPHVDDMPPPSSAGTAPLQPSEEVAAGSNVAPVIEAQAVEVEDEFILPSVVPTIPGRSEMMYVALGHINRIETPFKYPTIRHGGDDKSVKFEFDQNYVYVTVTQPTTVFIYDDGHPDPAIVLSLIPRRIAPRQVKVTVPPNALEQIKKNSASTSLASRASSSGSEAYTPPANSKGISRQAEPAGATEGFAGVLRTYASGRLPRGYTPVTLQGFTPEMLCKRMGVQFSFRQGAAIGSNEYVIIRGMAEANRPVSLIESECALHPETLAVAFAPRTEISKDHPTDFYVLIRRPNAAVKSAR
ncbi:hypothetical protein D2T29_12855 [Sinirhodobacter populi]|uniref:Conjugal transfer protein TraK n=1 Tax=Paenirhodobacter populi TaxID=2306993 RepID=A0A443KCU3_9RHOB|nr:hypothetical protein [Sinirhodobacter populi]RWR30555.1 hypothetical protein D2T29_12855 [Sinirhodobacter populi]